MIKDKTKKKKVNAPSDKNNTNQKRGSSSKTRQNKEEKKQYDRGMEMGG